MPDGAQVPLRGICLLERGDFAVRQFDRLEAAALLPSMLRRPHWQAKSGKSSATNQVWLEIISRVPVFQTTIPHGLDTLPATIDRIRQMLYF